MHAEAENGGLLPQAMIVLLILDFGIARGQDANPANPVFTFDDTLRKQPFGG